MLTRRIALAAAAGALAAPARSAAPRVVAAGGAITEAVYALGAQALLVGVDSTSLHPAAARALPGVGYLRALSAEGVLSLAPTLLLAHPDAGPPAVLQQLRAARVAVETVDVPHSVAGVGALLRRVGALCGRAEAGAALAARTEAEAEAARQSAAARAAGRPPRVLFVMAHSPAQLRVAGADTAADAMITLAGAHNVLAGAGGFSGYKPLTPEAAIAAAPDVILATDQGLHAAGGADGLLRLPGLAATPAGRARRVVALDALLLLGFGPRTPQAIRQLAEALHGGARA